MKTFIINISPELADVSVTVKNGAAFSRSLIQGVYRNFEINVHEKDIERVKKFSVKNGTDKSSGKGMWYAHCNGFAMDLNVYAAGKSFSINTYRPYGQVK